MDRQNFQLFYLPIAPPPFPVQELEKKVQSWVKSVGGKMEVTVEKTPPIPLTSTDSSDPWWSAFSSAMDKQ